jgi:ribosomal RNA-processing protein 9
VKVFDLNPGVMGYVETLFGHQDHILALDALRGDSCVSVGARDKTARFWKILDETQLVFRGGGRSRIREVLEGGLQGDNEKAVDSEDEDMEENTQPKPKAMESKSFIEGSMECIAMIDETTFVTGGDSGCVAFVSYIAHCLIVLKVQFAFGIHRRRSQCLLNLSRTVLARRFQPQKASSRRQDGLHL